MLRLSSRPVLRACLITSCAGLAVAAADSAHAQSAPAEAPARSAGGLEDIIVTARKRAESLQDIPVVATALSREAIAAQDISNIDKIAAITPNFTVGRASSGSGAQMTLRGIGSSATSIGIEQSLAVVVDGVYYGQGRIIQEGFFDLERIELLKGPQALFFGKNATAGVLSITTADPTNEPYFEATADYEFKAQQPRLGLVYSTPLTDTLGIRIAVRAAKMFGGYFKNRSTPVTYATSDIQSLLAGGDGNPVSHTAASAPRDEPGEKELLGRLTIKWTPTDRLTATFKASGDYNMVNNNSWNYVTFYCPTGVSQLGGGECGRDFITKQNRMPTDIAADYPFAKKDGGLYNRYKSFAATANIAYDLDQATVTSVTNYNSNNNRWACDCDFQPQPIVFSTENSTWKAFSSELRLLTKLDGPINIMIGGLYQKTKRDFEQYVGTGGLSNSAASTSNNYVGTSKVSYTDGETLSAFGQVIWKLVDTVELSGGIRYTHETKDSYLAQNYNNPGLSFIYRDAADPDGLGVVQTDQTFTNWSPEVTVNWKPSEGLMIFGSFKTGYKSGGFSNGGINSKFSSDPTSDLTFEPERAIGFEGGIKSTLANRQLRLNLTLYSYLYKDLQVDFYNAPIFAFQTNTADARTKGIELTAEYAPRAIAGLNIHGSLNYNRARYTRFADAPCYAGQRINEGCTNISGIFNQQDLSGHDLAMAPKWTGQAGVAYMADMTADLKAGLSVDARYSSSYLASSFGNEDSRQAKYVSLDASVRVGTTDERWELALIGKNLTNRFYVTSVLDGPATGSGTGTAAGVHSDQIGTAVLPRTVQLQLRFRY